MKYYKRIIYSDPNLFDNISAYRFSKLLKISASYLNRVKNGELIISEEQYERLVKAKKEYLNNT